MVGKKTYIPESGDIVWINFNPTRVNEQKGKRLALVVSPKTYNRASRLALFCPITAKSKEYPFEVALLTSKIPGFVLVDQVRSLNWHERKVVKNGNAPASVLETTQELLGKLLA